MQIVDEPGISSQIDRFVALQIDLEGPNLLLRLHSNGIEPFQHLCETSTMSLLSRILPNVQFEIVTAVEAASTLLIDLRTGVEKLMLQDGSLVV